MKVVILAGGISTERDVSLSTGGMIYRALKQIGHQAVILDVYLGYEGEIGDIFEKDIEWDARIESVAEREPDLEAVRAKRRDGGKSFFGPNVLKICRLADACFLALHGSGGEDGRIQACFDLLHIPYTGSDYVGSALAMNKGIAKDLFRAYHIPTPEGIRLGKGEEEARHIPYPCMVKAACGGSSVGVCIAHNDQEYEAAKELAFRYDTEVVIEQYIEGREFSVGVLDHTPMPVIEIAPKEGFYDYKNKYQEGSTVETCPAHIPTELSDELQRLALEAYEALRLRSYARVDFIVGKKGDIYCLEANTLPGMTPTSLLPQEAAAAGISFEALCGHLLEQACR